MKIKRLKKDIRKNADIQKKRKEIEKQYHNEVVQKIELMIKQLSD